MNFCPECSSLLQITKKGTILKCPKCKYQKTLEQEEINQKTNLRCPRPIEIAVIDKDVAALSQMATVKVVCLECGHNESETWTVETANETIHASVTFFRCKKCGTTRRETG